MSPGQAILFIKKHGVVLESAHGSVPNLAETVTGKRIHGSWWTDPKARDIFRLTRAVRDSGDILVCRLVSGKITFVHRRVWPALVRLANQFGAKSLGRIREVHTPRGKHELHILSYPRWVPADVKISARKISETEAALQLGDWCSQSRKQRSGGADYAVAPSARANPKRLVPLRFVDSTSRSQRVRRQQGQFTKRST